MPKGPIRYSPEGCVLPDEYLVKNVGDHALIQLEIIIEKLESMGSVFMTAKELAETWDIMK